MQKNEDSSEIEALTIDFLNDLKELNETFLEFKTKFEKSLVDLNDKSKKIIELLSKESTVAEDNSLDDNETAKNKICELIRSSDVEVIEENKQINLDNETSNNIESNIVEVPVIKIKQVASEIDYYFEEKFGIKKCKVIVERLNYADYLKKREKTNGGEY
jgi:hypothetical protein